MSAELAKRIAEVALREPEVPSEEPELAHVTRVVEAVVPEARDVAWLHDVLERSSLEAADLLIAGFDRQTSLQWSCLLATRRPTPTPRICPT